MPNGSEKSAKDKRKTRRKIVREFDKAGRALCDAHDIFMDGLTLCREEIISRQGHLEDLLDIVDRASVPVKGRMRESVKLKRKWDYKISQSILGDCRSLFNEKEREVNRKLKYPKRDFKTRVFGLPMNARYTDLMKEMTAGYQDAIPIIAHAYETALDIMGDRNDKLPVSIEEYRKKWPAYEARCKRLKAGDPGTAEDKIRDLTRKTFDKLRARYTPRLVPLKK